MRKTTSKNSPRKAHPKPDPIYAAIAKHKAAMADYPSMADARYELEKKGIKKGPRYTAMRKREDATMTAITNTCYAMCATVPKTAAGLVALTDYAREIYSDEIGPLDEAPGALLATFAKAAKRLAAGARP